MEEKKTAAKDSGQASGGFGGFGGFGSAPEKDKKVRTGGSKNILFNYYKIFSSTDQA